MSWFEKIVKYLINVSIACFITFAIMDIFWSANLGAAFNNFEFANYMLLKSIAYSLVVLTLMFARFYFFPKQTRAE